MARINLMPWREKRRQERQRAFVSLMGFAALAAVAVLAMGWLLRAGQIEIQESRNSQLTREIDEMKKKVEEIQDLDIKRDRLLGRKQVIEELQSNRSHMVHLFDQLVRTVPEGIMLSSVNQRGTALTIEGRSESNSRVSEYLRRLDASGWLDRADLKIIEEQAASRASASSAPRVAGAPELPYFFRVQVAMVNPQAPALDEDGNPIGPSVLDAAVSEDPVEQAEQANEGVDPDLDQALSQDLDQEFSAPLVESGLDGAPAQLEPGVQGVQLPQSGLPDFSQGEAVLDASDGSPEAETDTPTDAPPPGEDDTDMSEER